MVGLIGNDLIIFSCDVDIRRVTVSAAPGGFRLATQREGARKEARNCLKMRRAPRVGKLVVIVWT